MASLEEYREQQLAMLRQHGEQTLEELRRQVHQNLGSFAEEAIQKLEKAIQENNEDAIRLFGEVTAEHEAQKNEWPPELVAANDELSKLMLDTILESNKKLLDGCIERIRRELKKW